MRPGVPAPPYQGATGAQAQECGSLAGRELSTPLGRLPCRRLSSHRLSALDSSSLLPDRHLATTSKCPVSINGHDAAATATRQFEPTVAAATATATWYYIWFIQPESATEYTATSFLPAAA